MTEDAHMEHLFISNARSILSEAMLTGTPPPPYILRADTFKRLAEAGPRLAHVAGEGRLSLVDFLPKV